MGPRRNDVSAIPTETELVALWRKTREPAVADVLAALGRVTPLAKAPSPKLAVVKKWLAWAAKADVASVCFAYEASAQTATHLPALDGRDPDPRLGRFAIRMLAMLRGSDSAKSRVVHERYFALVAAHADVDVLARLERLARMRFFDTGYITTTPWFEERIADAIARLAGTVPRPTGDAALRAKCATWIATLAAPPMTTRREQLLAAVYAAPEDDGPRAVLADHLQQAGEPHGTLIALQLAGVERGVASLLAKHARRLVPPAIWQMMVGDSVGFERGFPARGRVWPRRTQHIRPAVGAFEWATFHTLDLGSFAGWNTGYTMREWILELVADPAMRWLRHVGPMRAEELLALLDHGVALPWTSITIVKPREQVERVFLDDLAGAAWLLPSLRQVSIDLPRARLPGWVQRLV